MPSNPSIRLKSRPAGKPTEANFELAEEPVPSPRPGEFLYRTLYLSVDPYLRGRMNEGKSYVAPFALGERLQSAVVGEVVRSEAPGFASGDRITGLGDWALYGVSDGRGFTKLPPGVPPEAALGVLGMPGLTAYIGLFDIGKPKVGETVVVSASSGAVGSVVGQLAKLRGCRAIGIAGSPEKCAYVVDELGLDACIDYKRENVAESLARHCPAGIDIYFENVGGSILEAVLRNLRDRARIVLCGLISEYNASQLPPGPNLRPVLAHRAKIEGFIVSDHWDRFPEFLEEVAPLVRSGRIKHREDIVPSLEKAPAALIGLLEGRNFGKCLVKVSD